MSASPITSKACSSAGCQGATGSSALFLARQAVASGTVECALAVGFEQMKPGALKRVWDDRPAPMFRFDDLMTEIQGVHDAPRTAQMFYRNHVDNAVARPSSVPGGQIWSAAASTEAGA